MFNNYLKIAIRNLLRQKEYSLINVAGLTLGLTCCLLIFQYVTFEYSFDTFNQNAENLYRVYQTTVQNEGQPQITPHSGYAMGPALAQEVPEVVRFLRLHPDYNHPIVSNPAQPDKIFEETQVCYADPTFFQMFSFPLLTGTSGTALSEPGTVVLSQSTAKKYFGTENSIGKTLDVAGWIRGTFRVNGIFEDVPNNSHLQFDILLPMTDLLEKSGFKNPKTGWGWNNFITYIQLREDANQAEIARKFTDVLTKHQGDSFLESRTTAHLGIQPLLDIHLNHTLSAPMTVMGSYRTVYFFSLTGLVVFLIALVNYINLATARALNRAREVGVRKVVGAQRGQLIAQFLCESALTNLLAIALAIALAEPLRPVINHLIGTNLTHTLWHSPEFWIALPATFCLITLFGGLYPAFILSSFRPVAVLKGKYSAFAAQGWLRRGLVIFQFAASIALLAGTAIVHSQIDFMRHMDLGIHLNQILTVPSPRIPPKNMGQKISRAQLIETFTTELRRLPSVQQVATSSTVPGQGFDLYTSNIRKAGGDPSMVVNGVLTEVDTGFAALYGFELVAGEGFKNPSGSASKGEPRPAISNETAIRALGFDTPENALGKEVNIGGNKGRLVGVFKDFYWSSAHEVRENIFFFLEHDNRQISIKVSAENLPRTIAAIERIYKQHFPGNPFQYAFVDEQFDQQYRNDQRFASLFSFFAGLAIAIACLGLFGLASFTAQQRTKEIGIRKVLGASVANIVMLLSKDFLKLVVIAFILGAPIAYFAMQRWLTNFAYRIDPEPVTFLLSGMLALAIALLTISGQSIKAALSDPVKSLRDE